MSYIFTSESVSEGHPDKICDQISDAILDECIKQDKYSRVACETMIKNNHVIVGGEITSKADINYEEVAKSVIKDIGYNNKEMGFSHESINFKSLIGKQSEDIHQGISKGDILGSGDQGLMFGYACKETKELMPLPISLAHKLMQKHKTIRNINNKLWPDAKSQVSVQYSDNYEPERISAIVFSAQHCPSFDLNNLREFILEEIIRKVIPDELIDDDTKFFINPAGKFSIGGPVGDCGMTGRKIIVDSYGGMARHGGGAFSGKDPSKVDRSAAYAMRQVAKTLVNENLCDYCEVQVSYAIGVENPVSIYTNTFESEKIPLEEITKIINKNFDLTPQGIISNLSLLNPIYLNTAKYGHFGREDQNFSWEKTKNIKL